MDAATLRLVEDLSRVIRHQDKRIQRLEGQMLNGLPVGFVGTFGGSVRSPLWSENRDEAIDTAFSRRWRMNELTGPIIEESEETGWEGILGGSTPPKLAQPGGLPSDGGYSTYFAGAGAGANTTRITLPLVNTTSRGWTMEAVFSPDLTPQSAAILSNGNGSSNGVGMLMNNGAGASGNKLALVVWGTGYYNTGITLVPGRWYDAIFISDDGDNTFKWYVGEFDPITRDFNYYSSSTAMGAPVVPTGNTIIGSDGAASARVFKGWVDEVAFHNTELTATQAQDRVRATVQPSPPPGWMAADGSAIPRQKYAQLFSVIGTKHGPGDGTTTFNVPNIPAGLIKL